MPQRRKSAERLKVNEEIMHEGKPRMITELNVLPTGSIEIHMGDTVIRRTASAKIYLA